MRRLVFFVKTLERTPGFYLPARAEIGARLGGRPVGYGICSVHLVYHEGTPCLARHCRLVYTSSISAANAHRDHGYNGHDAERGSLSPALWALINCVILAKVPMLLSLSKSAT
jgi:hypothetical protein